MAINFPDSPSNDDVFTSGEKSWIYRSAIGAWDAYSTAEEAQPDIVLIDTQTASASPSIDFDEINSTYAFYEIVFHSLVPVTSGAYVGLRTSTNGGGSYDSGGSDYEAQNHFSVGNTEGGSRFSGSYIRITGSGIGNGANESCSGSIRIYSPSSAGRTQTTHEAGYYNTLGDYSQSVGSGLRVSATAIDALQVVMNTGNIDSGTFKLYGYK